MRDLMYVDRLDKLVLSPVGIADLTYTAEDGQVFWRTLYRFEIICTKPSQFGESTGVWEVFVYAPAKTSKTKIADACQRYFRETLELALNLHPE